MGFRFRRSVHILPGVRVNFSQRGASVTVGKRGASVTVGQRGTFANVGLPGTGISYRTRLDDGPASANGPQPQWASPPTKWASPPAQSTPTRLRLPLPLVILLSLLAGGGLLSFLAMNNSAARVPTAELLAQRRPPRQQPRSPA